MTSHSGDGKPKSSLDISPSGSPSFLTQTQQIRRRAGIWYVQELYSRLFGGHPPREDKTSCEAGQNCSCDRGCTNGNSQTLALGSRESCEIWQRRERALGGERAVGTAHSSARDCYGRRDQMAIRPCSCMRATPERRFSVSMAVHHPMAAHPNLCHLLASHKVHPERVCVSDDGRT